MGSQQHPAPTQAHYTINGKWVGETNYPDTAEGLTQNQETLLASEAEGHHYHNYLQHYRHQIRRKGQRSKICRAVWHKRAGGEITGLKCTQRNNPEQETKTTPQPFDKLRREHDRHFTIIITSMTMITIVIIHHHGYQRLITHLPLVRIGQGDTC